MLVEKLLRDPTTAEARPHGIHPGFSPYMALALAKAGLMKDDDGKKFYHIITASIESIGPA